MDFSFEMSCGSSVKFCCMRPVIECSCDIDIICIRCRPTSTHQSVRSLSLLGVYHLKVNLTWVIFTFSIDLGGVYLLMGWRVDADKVCFPRAFGGCGVVRRKGRSLNYLRVAWQITEREIIGKKMYVIISRHKNFQRIDQDHEQNLPNTDWDSANWISYAVMNILIFDYWIMEISRDVRFYHLMKRNRKQKNW